MKTLYEAANAIEAHMLLDLLRQEGLTAHIHGEHLQGAMGELPAAGLVRLVTDEQDYDKARAVIERWESVQPAEPAEAPWPPPRPVHHGLLIFLAGLAAGIGGMVFLFHGVFTENGIDVDRDGQLDTHSTYNAFGTPLKTEVDRNLDRKIDYTLQHDARGLATSGESDEDFDGVFETRMHFRDNELDMTQTDTDGDGFGDLRTWFKNGVMTSTENLDRATGHVLRVAHYRLGVLTDAEIDTDRDGTLDVRITYNALGEITDRRRIEPQHP